MHTRKILYVICFTFLLIFCFNSIQITTEYTIEDRGFEVEEYKFEENNFCKHIFNSQIFDVAQIWHSNRKKIYNASHHLDLQNIFQTMPTKNGSLTEEGDFMYTIFSKFLTTNILRRGIIHTPSKKTSYHIVEKLVKKIQSKMLDPSKKQIQIVVVGGSVTAGRGCGSNGSGDGKICAWPRRLELLINNFVGRDVVKIHNLAIGGTSTAGIGENIIRYWLYPEELKENGPDIIVNAYSTNDSYPGNHKDQIFELLPNIHEHIENFIRISFLSKPCSYPPLVVNFDDYLGPFQESVLGELSYNTAVTRLSKWYDTLFLSYADVVRDFSYGNRSDTTFSNPRDVHFGRWAHQSIAWTIAYGFLEVFSNFCTDTSQNNFENMEQSFFTLPPPLTKGLLLRNISAEINAQPNFLEKKKCNTSNVDQNPCPVAWIAAPNLFTSKGINQFMQRFAKENINWATENNYSNGGFQNKFGLVPTNSTKATFTLRLGNFEKYIKTITIVRLISYGKKWKDSKIFVTVSATSSTSSREKKLATEEISGYHNMSVSLTVPYTIILKEANKMGDEIKLKIDLVGGQTFKILGLAFCSV